VYLDSVTFRFMPEAGARDAALQTGQVQINETTDGPTAKRLRGNPNLQVIPVLPWAAMILKFNMAQGIGADLNFRRAVAQSLNLEEIMAVAYADIYRLDTSWVFAGSAYHTGRTTPKQDLVAAKASLAKSAYKGEKVTFIVHNDRPTVDTATVIQQQLAQIGVTVDLKVADWPTTSKIGLGSDEGWNLWTHGFGIEPYEGPASSMSHWVKGQGQRKADPMIDSIFDRFNSEMIVNAQQRLFTDFEKQMNDQVIAVNMGNFGLFQVATTKLKNFKPYRIPRMWGVWLD